MSPMNIDPAPEQALGAFKRRWLPYAKTAAALLLLWMLWFFAAPGDGGSGGGLGGGHGTGYGPGRGSGSGGMTGSGVAETASEQENGREEQNEVPDPGMPEPAVPDGKAAAAPEAPDASPRTAPARPDPAAVIAAEPTAPPSGSPAFGLPGGTGRAGGGGGGFYGETVDQDQNVVFIVDVSTSMGQSAWKGSRMDALKLELQRAIAVSADRMGSRRGCYFFCIYGTTAELLPTGKRPWRFGNRKDQAEAMAAIDGLRPGGKTNMTRAWQAAEPLFNAFRIRTVYFLTDGGPTDGFNGDTFMTFWKNHQEMHLCCIAVGGENRLLKEMAKKAAHGSFRVCK